MAFKGRTVILFVLLAMFGSSIMTLMIVNPGAIGVAGMNGVASSAIKSGLNTKDVNKLSTTYQLIEGKFLSEVDHDKVVNGAINGMLSSLEDPFTVYMDQKEAKQFDESITSSFQGIGAEVSSEDGKVTIVS